MNKAKNDEDKEIKEEEKKRAIEDTRTNDGNTEKEEKGSKKGV